MHRITTGNRDFYYSFATTKKDLNIRYQEKKVPLNVKIEMNKEKT